MVFVCDDFVGCGYDGVGDCWCYGVEFFVDEGSGLFDVGEGDDLGGFEV